MLFLLCICHHFVLFVVRDILSKLRYLFRLRLFLVDALDRISRHCKFGISVEVVIEENAFICYSLLL